MKSIYTVTLFVVVSLLFCCKTSRVYENDYPGMQLHFGQGGGFTGAVTYFVLLDDGRLFQRGELDSAFTYLSTWKKGFTRQMFDNYETLGLSKIEFYHPGNLYYFIEHHSQSGHVHQISWGQAGETAPENVIAFYRILYKSTDTRS